MKTLLKNLRLSLSAAALALCFGAAVAQTATVTHTVDRGETIESIAERYGVTPAQILAINPDAKSFVYVGMVLTIPASAAPAATTPAAAATAPAAPAAAPGYTAYTPDGGATSVDDYTTAGPGFAPCFEFDFGFLQRPKGTTGFNYSLGATIGAKYYFLEKGSKVFAGVMIGYNSFNANQKIKETKETYDGTAHCITVPISVGYTFSTNNKKYGFSPYIGLDLNCVVSGKFTYKQNREKEEFKATKGLCPGFRVGGKIHLSGWDLGAAYVFPLNDKMKDFSKDGFFAVSVGWTLFD